MIQTDLVDLNFTSFEAYQKQKSNLVPSHFTRLSLFEQSVDQLAKKIEEYDIEASEKQTLELFDIFMDLILALDETSKTFEDIQNYQKLLFAFLHQSESFSVNCRKKAQNCFRNFLKLFDYDAQSKCIIQLYSQIYNNILKVKMQPQILAFLCDIYRQKFDESKQSEEIFEKNLPNFYSHLQLFNYPILHEATQFYLSAVLLIRLQITKNLDLPLLKSVGQEFFNKINSLVVDYIHLMELSKKAKNSSQQGLHEIFPLEILKMHIVETGRLLKSIT